MHSSGQKEVSTVNDNGNNIIPLERIVYILKMYVPQIGGCKID